MAMSQGLGEYEYQRMRQEEAMRGRQDPRYWDAMNQQFQTARPQQGQKMNVFDKDNRNDNLLLLLENVI
jgi:hypothetical protein